MNFTEYLVRLNSFVSTTVDEAQIRIDELDTVDDLVDIDPLFED